MPNRYHTDNPQLKIHAPEKGAGYPGKGGVPAMPYKCPAWGLKGLPTQGKSRAQGVKPVRQYAKQEGL